MYNELNLKLESDKQSFIEIVNQKKDLNETVINLEKQVTHFLRKTLIFKTMKYFDNLNSLLSVSLI